jgi:hypothetical protein
MSGEPKSSAPFNSLAWLLATCPDSTVRDGGKAAGYINQALELEPDRWTIWDTRAAVSLRTAILRTLLLGKNAV